MCIRQVFERFVVTCRDNFVDLTRGSFVVQIVNFHLVGIPETFFAIHVTCITPR